MQPSHEYDEETFNLATELVQQLDILESFIIEGKHTDDDLDTTSIEIANNNVEKAIETFVQAYSIDKERIAEPVIGDITNDGNAEIIIYNEVYPTDFENNITFIATFDSDGQLLTHFEKEHIYSISLIKNRTYGNVLLLHSPPTSRISSGAAIAYDNGILIEIGDFVFDQGFDTYRIGKNHEVILTNHIDMENTTAMVDAVTYPVVYYWNEKENIYVAEELFQEFFLD